MKERIYESTPREGVYRRKLDNKYNNYAYYKKCLKCANFMELRTKNCRYCRSDAVFYKEKSIGEYRDLLSVKGKHPSWINTHARSFARSWNKDLCALPCQKCSYSLHVELCHIKAVGSYSDEAKLGEINSRENILALCRNCHWEFDNNLISLEDIPLRPTFEDPNIFEIRVVEAIGQVNQFNLNSTEYKNKRNISKYTGLPPNPSYKTAPKIDWPSKEELSKLIWEKPASTIAKELGVSDKAVEKYCKKHDIEKPFRGYWAKQKALANRSALSD